MVRWFLFLPLDLLIILRMFQSNHYGKLFSDSILKLLHQILRLEFVLLAMIYQLLYLKPEIMMWFINGEGIPSSKGFTNWLTSSGLNFTEMAIPFSIAANLTKSLSSLHSVRYKSNISFFIMSLSKDTTSC